LELSYENLVGARQCIPRCHFYCKTSCVRDVLSGHNKLNQILLFNVNGEDLTNLIYANHAVCCLVAN